ncbi:NAD(P)/FAD-dependent oxidoreductase [uncultured Friedmanniella sp.]|uniref:NAD(P)/FAD-dependent oxidoreductase n=1 Tax=uncultured Friedmanniella sp. TaxID=335381 RepID=UPI0035CA641B
MPAFASVLVVGASLAGHATARALRAEGFDGQITLVGAEPERPYDRPPLSKAFLAGTATEADLALESPVEELQVDWVLGVPATELDAAARAVTLADGRRLSADAVVLATGSGARHLPHALGGVHTLRNLADARALRAELVPGVRVVVVGAGFIGAEVASTVHGLGLDVTVVEAAPAPLAGPLGVELGLAVAALHERHGVRLECGVPVADLTGRGRVTGVALADGTVLPADVVVVGIGSHAATDWLVSSGLDVRGGVACSATGATAAPGVWAVGDCAAWYDPARGTEHRLEHWTDALERPATMVKAMLGLATKPLRAPYFWSEQYGVMIQFAGRHLGGEDITIEAGSVEDGNLLATYRRPVPGGGGLSEVVGVLGMNQPKLFTRARRTLASTPTEVEGRPQPVA